MARPIVMCELYYRTINKYDNNKKKYLKSGRRQVGEQWREMERGEG